MKLIVLLYSLTCLARIKQCTKYKTNTNYNLTNTNYKPNIKPNIVIDIEVKPCIWSCTWRRTIPDTRRPCTATGTPTS